MVDVIVPLQEISSGTKLEARMFRSENRPQVGISERAVRSIEEVRGHFTRALILAGQPLARDVLTTVQPKNQLTANIPPGYRAVTIRVDARAAVEGFVRPGTNVDVVWASSFRGRPGVSVIVQNAKVLSAERSLDEHQVSQGGAVPSTVTLLVTAHDASKVHVGSNTGSLSLSLRGDDDSLTGFGAGTVTVEDLYAGDRVARPVNNREGTLIAGGKLYVVQGGTLIPQEDVFE
jgi:pilus assembly protein CpaB